MPRILRIVRIPVLASLHALLLGAEVRLNEAQVIGTHNSYHLAPHESLLTLIAAKNPDAARSLQYSHRPLPDQFTTLGIRQIELDLFADPEGGLFAEPRGITVAREQGLPIGANHDPDGLLRQPGFKVLHLPDFDFRSTTLTLVDGLRQIRQWSAKHPRHFPIFVLVELKHESAGPGFTRPRAFGLRELDALDAEILSVFGKEQILTPDAVRGTAGTLREAVTKKGWPTLDAVRGKVMFALDNGGAVRDLYLENRPALRGRVLYVDVDESHPAAAWMKVNDPVADFDRIQKLVRAGFLVRTRADADTMEARANDPSRREKAFASGAQFVSTDYPEADPTLSGYRVRFDGGVVVRANPVNGNPDLAGKELE